MPLKNLPTEILHIIIEDVMEDHPPPPSPGLRQPFLLHHGAALYLPHRQDHPRNNR